MNERLYRTRRQPYNLQNYNENAIESIKYALDRDMKPTFDEQSDPSTVDTLPVAELEFLINDESPDDYFNKNQAKSDADVMYEKAFSRKYKHPRQFSRFSNNDEFLLENVKRNSKNDDYYSDDYDDINEEIELPRRDTASLENAVYTEGGLIQAANDNSDSDTNGKILNDLMGIVFRGDFRLFCRKRL